MGKLNAGYDSGGIGIGDVVWWHHPRGGVEIGVYMGLEKPSSFSRAYGRQAYISLGTDDPEADGTYVSRVASQLHLCATTRLDGAYWWVPMFGP